MGNQQASLDKQDLIRIPLEGEYYTDGRGKVYSFCRGSCKELRQWEHFGRSKNPYKRVKVAGKLWLSHRLIASVLTGEVVPANYVVNHKDGDTCNNHLKNLEVVTQRENVQHAIANNLYCSGRKWYEARGLTRKRESFND